MQQAKEALKMRIQISLIGFASLRQFLCCFKSNRMKILEKGEERISKRLDIVRLYRHQAYLDLAYKIIFSHK